MFVNHSSAFALILSHSSFTAQKVSALCFFSKYFLVCNIPTFNMTTIGTDRMSPKMPPICSPANNANIITSGWMRKLFPTIKGLKMFPSQICKNKIIMIIIMFILIEIVAAIIRAGTAPMTGPK